MPKVLKLIAGIVLLYVVLMGGSGFAIKALISSSIGEQVRAKAQASLPVEVSIDGGEFDIAQWFLFRPAITFENLRVGNPEGFSSEHLLRASSLGLRANLTALFSDSIEIGLFELIEPDLRIETRPGGKTNIDALMDAVAGQSTEAPSELASDGPALTVQSLRIADGSIHYVGPEGSSDDLYVHNVNIEVDDFQPDSAFDLRVAADIFAESAINIVLDGRTGPFSAKSSPATGKLSIDAYPGRLPRDRRESYLGDFLADPGSASHAAINVDLEGDLLGTLVGTGTLNIADTQLGKPEVGQLPLRGEAAVMLTLVNPLGNPSYYLMMPEAEFELGAGKWMGGVEVQQDGGGLHGKSRGAIAGVQVNEMLGAFTDTKDVLFGLLELRRYDLEFRGSSAEEIQRSLTGSGRLELSDDRMALFDVVKTVEQHFNKILKGEQAAGGFTSFVRFGTDFAVANETVTTPNLLLENDAVRVGGGGSFNFANKLDYNLSSLITGAIAKTLGGRANADGIAQLAVPLRVKGDFSSPLVTPDFKAIAKQQAVKQATSLLDGLFNKNKDEAGEEGEGAPKEEENRLPFDLKGLLGN